MMAYEQTNSQLLTGIEKAIAAQQRLPSPLLLAPQRLLWTIWH
jgi:hypothetical protein